MFGQGDGPRSWIFSPGVYKRITGRRARTTIRRARGAATSDVPTDGLAPGGRTERSADALSSPLVNDVGDRDAARLTAVPGLALANRLTSAADTSPPVSQCRQHTPTLSTSEVQLRSVSHILCRSHTALNSKRSHCSITKAADHC